jgi:hypothetical protein
MTKTKIMIFIMSALACAACQVSAEPMEVLNHSFEFLNGEQVVAKIVPSDAPDYWNWGIGSGCGIEGRSSDGLVCACVAAYDSIYQLLDHEVAEGDEYTLKFDAFYLWSTKGWETTYHGRLYYDDEGERVPIDYFEETIILEDLNVEEWYLDRTLNVSIESGNPAIGKKLGIELASVDVGAGNNWFGFDNVRLDGTLTRVIKCINPPNHAEHVPVTTNLEWGEPIVYKPLYYDLYFGDDANEVSDDYFLNTPVLVKQDQTTWDPGGPEEYLDFGTHYYWRVDAYEPNDAGTGDKVNVGKIWDFTTIAEEVTIVTQPQSTTIPAGETAGLTIEAVSPTSVSYSWYKVGNDLDVLSSTDTLTIENVQLGDEGYYYCVLTNEIEPPVVVVSAEAQLLTERLMGWWKLDGDLTDSVALEVPDAPVHDGVGSVGYAEGIVDSAVQFTGSPSNIVVIPETADFFNFYPNGFTASVWIKDPSSDIGGIVSKITKVGDPDELGWSLASMGGVARVYLLQTHEDYFEYSAGLMDGQWHMITGVFDAELGQLRLYVDGVLVYQTYKGIKGVTGDYRDMEIGAGRHSELDVAEDADTFFSGLVDDVKLWSYPLSAYEVAIEYTNIKTDAETICPEELANDLNGDCRVDIGDIAELSLSWLVCNRYPTEFCD